MSETQINEAIVKALQDPKVVKQIATSISKEIVKQKTTASNDEEKLVKDHVIFAEAESTTGTYMTGKEISEEIVAFNPEITVRPRVFGKALVEDVLETKQSNQGRVYFIERVVEEITPEILDEIKISKTEASEKEDISEDTSEKSKDKKKDKKKNKKGKEEVAEDSEKETVGTSEKEEAPEVDLSLIIETLNEFEDLDEYKAYLSNMKRSKLIKHINKNKLPISVENIETEEVVSSIINLVVELLDPAEDKESPAEEVKEEESKKDKKKDKKSKKDKKKKKKNKS